MFDLFTNRHTPCTVDGALDQVVLYREKGSSTVMAKEYQYRGRFSSRSQVSCGSIVQTTDSFLVYSLRVTPKGDRDCSLMKASHEVQILHYYQEIDENYDRVGEATFKPVEKVIAFVQMVTSDLRQQEAGLLPTTVVTAILPLNANVREPSTGLMSLDRIVIENKAYQVDAVDRLRYPRLLFVQLSEDKR